MGWAGGCGLAVVETSAPTHPPPASERAAAQQVTAPCRHFASAPAGVVTAALPLLGSPHRGPHPPHTPSHRGLQLRGMDQDLSWGHAAEQYEDVLLAAKMQW